MAVKSVSMATVLVFVFTISHLEAKTFYLNCPVPQTKQSFSISQFAGVWIIHSVYFDTAVASPRCYTTAFAAGTVRGQMGMGFAQTYNGGIVSRGGLLTAISGDGSDGKFRLRWTDGSESNFYILDTDYKTYAYILLCRDTGNTSDRQLWIMTGSLYSPDYFALLKHKFNASLRAQSIKLMTTVPRTDCGQVRNLALASLDEVSH